MKKHVNQINSVAQWSVFIGFRQQLCGTEVEVSGSGYTDNTVKSSSSEDVLLYCLVLCLSVTSLHHDCLFTLQTQPITCVFCINVCAV